MKIAVIFTGGTIGSAVKDGWMSTDDSAKYILLEKYDNKNSETVFETFSPYTVLSENLSASEINLLQEEIEDKLSKDYDGIIVTHGTDTLQYSAVAAEFAFGKCRIPVVFVSSDYPPDDVRANAHANFNAAVEFIKKGGEKGVFVSYKNDTEDTVSIHIASRILSHRECDANLFSIDNKPYAVFENGGFSFCGEGLTEKNAPVGTVKYCDESGILVITSHPGDCFSYSLEKVRAVILRPYHSATLATSSCFLKSFTKKAKEKNIPVFVANVKDGISYDSVKEFSELGIISLPYGTFISAYMKMWAAVSLEKDIKEFMEKPIAYENVK